jgi:hypothetical protein
MQSAAQAHDLGRELIALQRCSDLIRDAFD